MTLLYWECHLIPIWLLRRIFARFPEQLLEGLVFCCTHFLAEGNPMYPCHGAKPVWYIPALVTSGYFGCTTIYLYEHILIWAYAYMSIYLYEHMLIWAYTYMSKYLYEHILIWAYTYMSLLALEPSKTKKLSCHSQYLCGTIFLTLYSKVWDWRVLRAGSVRFYWHN